MLNVLKAGSGENKRMPRMRDKLTCKFMIAKNNSLLGIRELQQKHILSFLLQVLLKTFCGKHT